MLINFIRSKMTYKARELKQIEGALIRSIYNEAQIKEGWGKRKNIDPKVWGPNAWKFIDNVVEGYPSNPNQYEKLRMYQFLTSLEELLPCETCRDNFSDYLRIMPVIENMKNKSTVKRWLKLYKRHQQLMKIKYYPESGRCKANGKFVKCPDNYNYY